MKKLNLLKLRATLLLLLSVVAMNVWGEESSIRYIFKSKAWEAYINTKAIV